MPPPTLPPMPGNVDPPELPEEQRAVLMRFETKVDGTPFIPASYRKVAHWPPVSAWLADELRPRFATPRNRGSAWGLPNCGPRCGTRHCRPDARHTGERTARP